MKHAKHLSLTMLLVIGGAGCLDGGPDAGPGPSDEEDTGGVEQAGAIGGIMAAASISLSGQIVIGTAMVQCGTGMTSIRIRLDVELWRNGSQVLATEKDCDSACSATAQLEALAGDWVAKSSAYTSDTPDGVKAASGILRCVHDASLGKVTCKNL